MLKCELCPVKCGTNKQFQKGFCGTDNNIKIAKYYLHPFEEPLISGVNGSGTIFFCGCSLKCVFCQNFELSRNSRGKVITVEELAHIFKELEDKGANNINLVNPTHYSNLIIEALNKYKPSIPIVYNTHGYENVEILQFIDPFIDVYLPDLKFYSPYLSERYTKRKNYFEIASKAIEFMAKKPLIINDKGLIQSGSVVRHLVLPGGTTDSKNILDFLSPLKDKIYLSLMSQYTPFGLTDKYPEINRKITKREYNTVLDYAISLGFKNMFFQSFESADQKYIP